MGVSGRAAAWLNLAWRFGAHVLFRMPRRALRRSPELPRFLAAVEQEGYVPLEAAERALVPGAMRCIHCGLCSFGCATLREAPASAWAEPWTFVAGPSRSIDRATLAAAGLPACTASGATAALCPTRVPIPALAEMTERLGSAAASAGDARARQ